MQDVDQFGPAAALFMQRLFQYINDNGELLERIERSDEERRARRASRNWLHAIYQGIILTIVLAWFWNNFLLPDVAN